MMYAGHGARSRSWLIALALAAMVAAGCPYDGQIPLGEPDPATFEPALIGRWQGVVEDTIRESDRFEYVAGCAPEDSTVRIMRFNAAEYIVSFYEEDCSIGLWRAYVTRLDDAVFLNTHPLEPSYADDPETTVSYSIVRVYGNGDTIRLRYVSDALEHVKSTAELQAALRDRIDDPDLYDSDSDVLLIRARRRQRDRR